MIASQAIEHAAATGHVPVDSPPGSTSWYVCPTCPPWGDQQRGEHIPMS